jgi:hypothetical protein
MASTGVVSNRVERVAVRRLPVAALIAAAVAVVANLVIFFLAGAFVPLEVQAGGPGSPVMPLTAVPVIVTSALPAFGAAVLLALLGRFLSRPHLIFMIIAIVFLLLSFGGPLSLQVNTGSKVVLSLMHVVAAVAIVGVLNTMGREK